MSFYMYLHHRTSLALARHLTGNWLGCAPKSPKLCGFNAVLWVQLRARGTFLPIFCRSSRLSRQDSGVDGWRNSPMRRTHLPVPALPAQAMPNAHVETGRRKSQPPTSEKALSANEETAWVDKDWLKPPVADTQLNEVPKFHPTF